MSALTSPVLGPRLREGRDSLVEAAQRHRAQLRLVPELTAQISHRVFWGLLITMVITGTTLLLMLNVTLQNQAFALRTLAAQDEVLQNQEASMQQELTRRSSSAQLAQRAVDLGMVPVTSPGFVILPDGTLIGEPEPAAAGGPYAGLRTPAEPAAPSAAPSPAATPQAGAAAPAASAAPSADPSASPAPAPSDAAAVQATTAPGAAASPSAVKTPAAPVQQPTTTAAPEGASSQEG